MSEADIIRLIYNLAADEGRSCEAIAKHLTLIGVPPAYARDGTNGKRRRRTAGIWYGGRVRHIIVNTTYKGIHEYGKRSKKVRETIKRPVPAIVDENTWDRAQETLHRNAAFSRRSSKRRYLLRGLIKCDLCGLHYVGCPETSGDRRWYRCSGALRPRGPYGRLCQKCPSKTIPSDLEDIVWADIEKFLRNPGPVLKELAKRTDEVAGERGTLQKDAQRLQRALDGKDTERDSVLGLFRRGRTDEPTLDRQLDEIERERKDLQKELKVLQARLQGLHAAEMHLDEADTLLRELSTRLDGPLSWDLRREIVETLVDEITVETISENGTKEARVSVYYRFTQVEICTDTPSASWGWCSVGRAGSELRSRTGRSACRTNGLLWIETAVNGTWNGYEIFTGPTAVEPTTWGAVKATYR